MIDRESLERIRVLETEMKNLTAKVEWMKNLHTLQGEVNRANERFVKALAAELLSRGD